MRSARSQRTLTEPERVGAMTKARVMNLGGPVWPHVVAHVARLRVVARHARERRRGRLWQFVREHANKHARTHTRAHAHGGSGSIPGAGSLATPTHALPPRAWLAAWPHPPTPCPQERGCGGAQHTNSYNTDPFNDKGAVPLCFACWPHLPPGGRPVEAPFSSFVFKSRPESSSLASPHSHPMPVA